MLLQDQVREIAKKYLSRVKMSGPENLMAICPFHRKPGGGEEKTPSFAINSVNGLWFCHSCKARGNLRSFLKNVGVSPFIIVKQYQGILDEVAKRIPKPPNPLQPKVLVDDPIKESLLGVFEKCPLALVNEGFEENTLRAFDIGFDDVHQRITFPLRDLAGKLVGISGRTVLEDDAPRYKVYTDEYAVWDLPPRKQIDKSHLIWNAHNVYPVTLFEKIESVVLVEGFKACMWVWQSEIKNTLALGGSYMSDQQQWILERMGVPVFLMLDNDDAGRKGTEYIGGKLSKSLPCVRIVEYEGHQPTDISPNQVHQALSQAKDYYLWAMNV